MRIQILHVFYVILLLFLSGCSLPEADSLKNAKSPPQKKTSPAVVEKIPKAKPRPKIVRTEHGKASFYSIRTNGGRHTASGERLSNSALTAAHKRLKFGTRVKVTNKRNGRSVIVRITDSGPYIRGRIIDLTPAGARRLNMVNAGVVPVRVDVLQ